MELLSLFCEHPDPSIVVGALRSLDDCIRSFAPFTTDLSESEQVSLLSVCIMIQMYLKQLMETRDIFQIQDILYDKESFQAHRNVFESIHDKLLNHDHQIHHLNTLQATCALFLRAIN